VRLRFLRGSVQYVSVNSFPLVASLIERAISSRAFPAAAIEVGRRRGVLWREAFGHLTYEDDSPSARDDTIFDLASLTKVIATGTLTMRAIDEGALDLGDRVADRLAEWRGADREQVTVGDLLEHAAGLTAYLPFFRDYQRRAEFQRAICTMALEYAPRTQSIYSDLGFILLGFILEDIYRKPFGEIFDDVFRLQVEDAGITFNPARKFRERCAPTELDLWRGRLLQGEVHDENAWALRGAAGHAGLFGTASAVGSFARLVLHGLAGDDEQAATTLARPETLARFVRKSTVPGSSRALAWDTMLPTSSCGTRLSSRAIGHTGFTGTSLWIDPELDLYVVFFTNRVHPTRDNNQIQRVRPRLHDLVVETLIG